MLWFLSLNRRAWQRCLTRSPAANTRCSPAALWQLGMALCVHAFFYQRYDNHPRIKLAVIAGGLSSFFLGLYLQFK